MIEPASLDLSIFTALNGDGGQFADFFFYWVSAKLTWVPFYAFLLWVVYKQLGLRTLIIFAVICAATIACADQTATLCKTYFPKLRPSHYEPLSGIVHTVYGYSGGLYGTVSSHAANSAALTMLLWLTLNRRWVWVTMAAFTVLISYSRIYLGVHYPADIALGLVEGAFWGTFWGLILRKFI